MRPEQTSNLNALRLIAAVMVVLGHSFALVGAAPPVLLGQAVSTIGVAVFFAISGFLVTRSWMNDPNLWRFAWRRARRIFPALFGVVLLTVCVIGLALTPLGPRDYLLHEQTLRYLGNMVLYISYTLPHVFADNIYPNAVNGSLWSLPVEVTLYALTPIFVLLGRYRLSLLAMLAVSVGLASHAAFGRPERLVIAGTEFWTACVLAPYFVTGALIARLRLERWLDARIGLGALAALHLVPLDARLGTALLGLMLPYAALAVGLRAWPGLRSAGRIGDASYGTYLWAFPVQQLAVHFMDAAGGGWGNFAVAAPISIALGLLSWHLVEKHALRFQMRRTAARPSDVVAARS